MSSIGMHKNGKYFFRTEGKLFTHFNDSLVKIEYPFEKFKHKSPRTLRNEVIHDLAVMFLTKELDGKINDYWIRIYHGVYGWNGYYSAIAYHKKEDVQKSCGDEVGEKYRFAKPHLIKISKAELKKKIQDLEYLARSYEIPIVDTSKLFY